MEIKSLHPNESNFFITSQSWFREIDYIGNIELLNFSSIAVFSSTKCPAALILRAHDYAKDIRNNEITIISGFHSPAEKEILEVILKGSCPIIVVLGRRLRGARILAEWKKEIKKGRMLVISPFKEYQAYVTKEMSIKLNDLAAKIAGHAKIIYASEEGQLREQIKKWKEDNIHIEYLELSIF